MKPHRRFAIWIASSGKSRAAIAAELSVCRSVVTYWCNGRHRPSLKSAKQIEFLTKGDIPAVSWGYAVDTVRPGPAKLQELLLQEGITVHALAKRLGVATTSARSWVNGLAVPNDTNLQTLSTLLQTELSPRDF